MKMRLPQTTNATDAAFWGILRWRLLLEPYVQDKLINLPFDRVCLFGFGIRDVQSQQSYSPLLGTSTATSYKRLLPISAFSWLVEGISLFSMSTLTSSNPSSRKILWSNSMGAESEERAIIPSSKPPPLHQQDSRSSSLILTHLQHEGMGVFSFAWPGKLLLWISKSSKS